MMQPMIYQTNKNYVPLITGLLGSLLVIISTILPFITLSFIITINIDAFQLSALIGIILVGGGIISFVGAIKYINAKSFDDFNFAGQLSLIGFIVQIFGFVLVFLDYYDAANQIDATFGSGISQFLINFGYGLFVGIIGATLVIIGYFLQKKEKQKIFSMMQPPMMQPPMMQPPLTNVQSMQPETSKYCRNCGSKIGNASFCTNCGTKVI